MTRRPWFTTILYRAFRAAHQMKIPLHQVVPGLLTQFDKMFTVAQFGAATERLQKATVDGKLDEGVQFIGQSQGLIHDVATVDELMQRIVREAREAHLHSSHMFTAP